MTTCSKTCGGGTQLHTRTIAKHEENDGAFCTGENLQEIKCNTDDCPAGNIITILNLLRYSLYDMSHSSVNLFVIFQLFALALHQGLDRDMRITRCVVQTDKLYIALRLKNVSQLNLLILKGYMMAVEYQVISYYFCSRFISTMKTLNLKNLEL